MQLAVALPGLAKARQELAVGGKLLDAVVAPIGHVNVAWRVESHPPGEVELTRATARLAPLHEVLPIGGELLHPVVMLVDDIEIVVGVYGDASRAVQLPIDAAENTPRAQEVSRYVKDSDAVILLISDVQSFLAIKGHSHGQYELPVPGASAVAKLSQVVLIPVHDAHPDEGPARRVAMVENEDAPVLAKGHIVGIDKAPAHIIGSYANRLDVVQSPWCGLCTHHTPPGGVGILQYKWWVEQSAVVARKSTSVTCPGSVVRDLCAKSRSTTACSGR